MKKVLFITNRKYVDSQSAEGGVKECTREFINLVENNFEVILFKVELRNDLIYRVKKKIGISVYEDYNTSNYESQLKKQYEANAFEFIFLNLTNTITFAPLLKKIFLNVKIILCSHGNESGDFLHDVVMHKHYTGVKKILAQQALGKMLILESVYRNAIELVLTVSEVEEMIEKWLGAKQVKLIPRTINNHPINLNPISGRVGFFGDLSHAPNWFGFQKICEALSGLVLERIEVRLVGSSEEKGYELSNKYPFVKYLGYLSEPDLEAEVSSWTFVLNPVFYYSRGVSTKLAKALGWGLPVITSVKGMRGYRFEKGILLQSDSPEEMAQMILKYSTDKEAVAFYANEIKAIQSSSPVLKTLMQEVYDLLLQT